MEDKVELAERLMKIEMRQEQTDVEVLRNGDRVNQSLRSLSDKLDALDAKWDARFAILEADQNEDKAALAALKNKGAGVLASVGVVGAILATIFSDMFAAIKHVFTG